MSFPKPSDKATRGTQIALRGGRGGGLVTSAVDVAEALMNPCIFALCAGSESAAVV